jgi:hypothetical protein
MKKSAVPTNPAPTNPDLASRGYAARRAVRLRLTGRALSSSAAAPPCPMTCANLFDLLSGESAEEQAGPARIWSAVTCFVTALRHAGRPPLQVSTRCSVSAFDALPPPMKWSAPDGLDECDQTDLTNIRPRANLFSTRCTSAPNHPKNPLSNVLSNFRRGRHA